MAPRKAKNISINSELDAELDRFPDENWSAIASRAFEVRIAELKAMNTANKEESTLQRLKASKLKHESEASTSGRDSGVSWVNDSAEYEHIRRLREHSDFRHPVPDSCYGIAELLAGPNEDARDYIDGIEDLAGEYKEDPAWCLSFMEGAMERAVELDKQL